MGTALEAAGASMGDVVRLTSDVVDGHGSGKACRVPGARRAPDPPPTIGVVVVTGLADPELLIEIDAVAVVEQMDVAAVLQDAYGRVGGSIHAAVGGLTPDQLTWRPDPDANPIGWLVWHLSRVTDDHVSEVAGRAQVWAGQDWASRFGLPEGSTDLGYGHTSDQVAAIRPVSTRALLDYHDAVAEAATTYLGTLEAEDLDRIVDDRWDPPVTLGVRLVSVIDDCAQHAGQAGYVRGLLDRRG